MIEKTHPQLSIIVPVYNTEKYLQPCIISILAQSFSNFELILINDGSTDSSGDICNLFAKKDNRIRVIHFAENRGVSSARNEGLLTALGAYIGFIDSDDYIHPDMYLLLMQDIHNFHSDIAVCNMYIMNSLGKFNVLSRNVYWRVYNRVSAMRDLASTNTLTNGPCNKLYKRELFDSFKFPEGIVYEDLDIIYRIFDTVARISYTKKPLYYYRYNNISITRKWSITTVNDALRVSENCLKYYRENYPEYAKLYYFLHVLRNHFFYARIRSNDPLLAPKYAGLFDIDRKQLISLFFSPFLRLRSKCKLCVIMFFPTIELKIQDYRCKKRASNQCAINKK